jgi:hypothetical protein
MVRTVQDRVKVMRGIGRHVEFFAVNGNVN